MNNNTKHNLSFAIGIPIAMGGLFIMQAPFPANVIGVPAFLLGMISAIVVSEYYLRKEIQEQTLKRQTAQQANTTLQTLLEARENINKAIEELEATERIKK